MADRAYGEELFELAFDGGASLFVRPWLEGAEWVVRNGLHEGRGATAEASVMAMAEKVVRHMAAKDAQA